MTAPATPRIFSIPFGMPFLPRLADALLDGELVGTFRHEGDPLALASVTIYVPTRRAARQLRSVFVDRLGGGTAILPTIKPLGDVDEDAPLFDAPGAEALALPPPVGETERLFLLAPLVKRWKERLPAHVTSMYDEPLVVPVTSADALWLARDIVALMDEVETEGMDWRALAGLVDDELAGWWQVTLEFLRIVTAHWPAVLRDQGRSNPARHRNALIDAEALRLKARAEAGPVIAAGSTGSIPATARLLGVIASLPNGAVVLPGLDRNLDERAWRMIGDVADDPAVFGHPQYGLRKLIAAIGVGRAAIPDLPGTGAMAVPAEIAARGFLVSEAMRPAGSTETWAFSRDDAQAALRQGALDGVSLVEADNEREEALAIAIALRRAIAQGDSHAALVTGDRALARRVSAELERFGLKADDSAGTPFAGTRRGSLILLLADCAFRPGDPVALLSLLKHPLLRCGLSAAQLLDAVSALELVALRGGTGRPDIARLPGLFHSRLSRLQDDRRRPAWLDRLDGERTQNARLLASRIAAAMAPLAECRQTGTMRIAGLARSTVLAFEALGADENGDLAGLYEGDEGQVAIDFLARIAGSGDGPEISPDEWPDVMRALISGEVVRPSAGADSRIAIWGALEARLQTVGTIVLGGLNEGSWPARARADRFMSRFMKAGLGLEPPERRIGLSAHDFTMALGTPKVVMTRAARSGEEPAVPSRWLQRLLTVAGGTGAQAMRARGDELLRLNNALDAVENIAFAPRPCPKPALAARPRDFSVTEIETLRRDPYAVHARRILRLVPLEPLLADPGAAERGTLFHEIVHRLTSSRLDPLGADARARLDSIARAAFQEAGLPADVHAVWWPRYTMMAPHLLEFERQRRQLARAAYAEITASPTQVGATGVTLRGRADRIDVLPDGTAHIIDFKTGSSPSVRQARTLLSPQLALEGALVTRGAFAAIGSASPGELLYVRLKADGRVEPESVLKSRNKQVVSASQLSERAWGKLGELIAFFAVPDNGYLSRSLPFRQGDVEGDYDHLARVLEWSAGGDDAGGGEE